MFQRESSTWRVLVDLPTDRLLQLRLIVSDADVNNWSATQEERYRK
ncbi:MULTISPECIES: hypothetical protein [unclassified Paenibacillus]